MKTISVIMPIYNAADYLNRALDNLAAQTLENMEFLLIDDCSEDRSYQLMKEFCIREPERAVVLQTPENLGPGGARNLGLEKASGEYIGFMDSDDEIVPQMYEKLYREAKAKDADIVDSGYYNEKLDYALLDTSDELAGELDSYKRSRLIVSGGYIVSKIFRRSFVEEQALRFREHVSLEDSEFITKTFATAKRIANVKEIFYKYTFTDYSASRERDEYRYYKNVIEAMKANYDAVSGLVYYPEIQDAVEYLIVQLYSYGVLKCLSICSEENKKEILEHLEEIRGIKQQRVEKAYEQNEFIMQKIPEGDIQVMRLNDASPEELIHLVLKSKSN